MKKIIFTFAFMILLFSVSFSSVLAMGHSNSRMNHPNIPMQSIGKISPNAAHGMHTAWQRIQNSNGMARHVFEKRFRPVGHPDVVLESVEYVGTCEKFGSHADETLTLIFSDDVFIDGDDQVDAQTYVYFEDAYRLGNSTSHLEYVNEDNKIIITSLIKFQDSRPEVGDYVIDLDGIVNSIGNDVVIPEDGVEVVKVGGECLVDTINVDSKKSDPTYSNIKLKENVTYQIKAMGVADAGDTIDFDASYSITNKIANDTWTNTVTGYESYGESLLGLHVDGIFPYWGEYNNDHIYYLDYTGTGNEIELWIKDNYYLNNSGSLTVEIHEVW